MKLTFIVLVFLFLILGVMHEQWKRETIEERTGVQQDALWCSISLLVLVPLEFIYVFCAISGYIPFP